MYGMRVLQFRMSGEETFETGDRFHEEDCACEPQEEIKNLIEEEEVNKRE